MKRILTSSLFIPLFALCITIAGCGGGGSDPAPVAETDAQKNQKILKSGTWTMQMVVVDGVDKTALYSGLKLTFSEASYTSVNDGAVWPTTGTWKFKDDTGKIFDRNDGVSVTINEIQDQKLVLALTWSKNTIGTGKITSVAGQHVFTFIK